MAVLLSDLQKWRDKLFQARMSGIREVRDSNGETITYRSDAEMAAALAAVDRAIAERTQSGRPVKTILFTTSKGV
jgi:hypothetical protein